MFWRDFWWCIDLTTSPENVTKNANHNKQWIHKIHARRIHKLRTQRRQSPAHAVA